MNVDDLLNYQSCHICKHLTRAHVVRAADGIFCERHNVCVTCNRLAGQDGDTNAPQVLCDTPACYAKGHQRCFRVLHDQEHYACKACKERWSLTGAIRCYRCSESFCTKHKRACLACDKDYYPGQYSCLTQEYHINGTCSAWCLDKMIVLTAGSAPLREPLTVAARAFIPPYFAMAVALAEFNWPVLVLLEILDWCVPPILLRATSMHMRWELLKLISRRWRAKNGCEVGTGAVVVVPEKRQKIDA